MNKVKIKVLQTILLLLAGVLLGVLGSLLLGKSNGSIKNSSMAIQQQQIGRENCVADDCLQVENLEYPAGELTQDAQRAMERAINDEYKARATYEAVLAQNNQRPFSMIIRAEERHIASLKALYDKYGLVVPEDPYIDNLPKIATSLAQNCQIGVQAELENIALYKDDLLPAVAVYQDVTAVFTSLMNASQQKHLPAFERCAN